VIEVDPSPLLTQLKYISSAGGLLNLPRIRLLRNELWKVKVKTLWFSQSY